MKIFKIIDSREIIKLIFITFLYQVFSGNFYIGFLEILIGFIVMYFLRNYGISVMFLTGGLVSIPYSLYLFFNKEFYKGIFLEEYNKLGLTDIGVNFNGFLDMLITILPAIHYVNYISFLLLILYFVNIFDEYIDKDNFLLSINLPFILIWLLIISLSFLAFEIGSLKYIGVNICLSLILLYSIEGLGIMLALFDKWGMGKLMKIFIFLIFLIQPILLVFVSLVGILNQWKNYKTKLQGVSEK